MNGFLLTLTVALVAAAVVFGVVAFTVGKAPGLAPADPDGVATDLPDDRPLAPHDLASLRFDTGLRGYRMDQVDRVLARVAHDLAVRDEQVQLLQDEIDRLADGGRHHVAAGDVDRVEV